MAEEFTVSENVTAAFERAIRAAGDLTPAMGRIAGELVTETKLNFAAERSPLGVPWKKSKRAIEEGGQTLVDRGFLVGSIKPAWGPNFAAAGPESSGASAIYAAIHQFGGKIGAKTKRALKTPFGPRGSVTLPARPYLGWNEPSERRVITILGDHIRAALAGGAA